MKAVTIAAGLFFFIYAPVSVFAQAGIITTYGGTGTQGYSGDGGPATSAQLNYPVAVALDSSGNLFVAEWNNSTIRKISPDGVITTVAGTGVAGFRGDGGFARLAQLNGPVGVAVDRAGNLFIADKGNLRVRKVAPSGVISTVAGGGPGVSGTASPTNGEGGPATEAIINPTGIAVDDAGNLYIIGFLQSIGFARKVTPAGVITTLVTGLDLSTPSQFVPVAQGITVDSSGNLFISEESHRFFEPHITKVTPSGVITNLDDGGFNHPAGLAVDASGSLYIADSLNSRIRRITPGGAITTVAGGVYSNGRYEGFSGDGGPASLAKLAFASGVVVDSAGTLFIADGQNHRIRKVTNKSRRDFNGDGTADVLWRDSAGNVSLWSLKGFAGRDDFLGNIWTGWTIAGIGDFNGDGKADILWRSDSGDVSIWLMDGATVLSYARIANIWTGWSIVGVGDFNADGKADVLWRDTSGDLSIWLMDGFAVSDYRHVPNALAGWSVTAVSDFDGDGKTDILWRSIAGEASLWLMDGFIPRSSASIGTMPVNASVAGVGDFNADGKSDILWRDSSGNVSLWLVNGNNVVQKSSVATIWTGWTIGNVGDFNGDGEADILWRSVSGDVSIWLMDGPTIMAYRDIGNIGDRRPQ